MMDKTTPVEITAAEADLVNMMRDFPELFDSFAGYEVGITFDREHQRWQLKVGGFYKHGAVAIYRQPPAPKLLGQDAPGYVVMGRYGELEYIQNFDDLVGVNHGEWLNYADRGFAVPDPTWLPVLLATGRVQEVVETKRSYQ